MSLKVLISSTPSQIHHHPITSLLHHSVLVLVSEVPNIQSLTSTNLTTTNPMSLFMVSMTTNTMCRQDVSTLTISIKTQRMRLLEMFCQGLVTHKLDGRAEPTQPHQVPPLPHVDVKLSMVPSDVFLQIQLCQASQLPCTGLDSTLECLQEMDIVWDHDTCSYKLLINPHMFILYMFNHLLIVN